ncbi:LADA_0B10462g1_1 [Lachancea dasiensis]|uniref:LADA_0B10462g1_1 n=1 Tax=Lachancea dasiensis TaxID=1072105 RepID=A0A1G4IV89_9SACH|nr:LADA_0B10462g1_1 [Lachancea dasiensis]
MPAQLDGFVPAHCIFYSLFHPTEGTKVRHEFPPGCLEASGIKFDTIKNYIIPKPQLCNKLLTFKYGSYRLVCYPVTVVASYYARNSFSFNFVFVFPYDCATSPYEPTIKRLGKMFTVLEEQSQLLSKAERDLVYFRLKTNDAHKHTTQDNSLDNENPNTLGVADGNQAQERGYAFEKYQEILKDLSGTSKRLAVDDLITRIFQDLNNYSECLIPIDSGNAVDIKLFPLLSPPNSCLSFEDVPISTVNLAKLIDVNWDPTMLGIVPYINGINSIAKIARFCNSDLDLVIECIKHLIYYNCVALVDIFQFSNIYAPTSELNRFLIDSTLAAACQLYVTFKDSTEISVLPLDTRSKRLSSTSNARSRNSSGTMDISQKARYFGPRDGSSISNTESSLNGYQNTPQSHNSSIPLRSMTDGGLSQSEGAGYENGITLPSKSCLFDLYRSLSQGQTVREWYRTHFEKLRSARIDVRRFITFGTIHGLLYRCYSIPVVKNVGLLESVKASSSSKDINTKPEGGLSHGDTLNSVFPAADIQVAGGNANSNSHRGRTRNFLTADAAEEALKDVYRKLRLEDNQNGSSNMKSPMAKFLTKASSNSPEISPVDGLNFSADSRNKVAFDMRRPLTPASADERRKAEVNQTIAEKKAEELLLLRSIRDIENFDKICTRLEKDREEVEGMIRDLGPYQVIHS